jgi:hypothetical protein
MKLSRIILGGALALAVVACMSSGFPIIEHAQAATAPTIVAMAAMAGMVSLKAPVTVFHKGQYVAPGTDIELPEAEARAMIARHGEYGGPAVQDPGNTQTRIDKASIDALNENAAINKGHGKIDPDSGGDVDLEAMKKDDLIALAAERGVALEANATKAEIIEKLRA